MKQEYNYEEDTQTQYTFTWVNIDYQLFITNIFADSEKEAIIKFFTEEDVDDVENYEIDLTE